MPLLHNLLNLYSGITPEENFFTEVFVAIMDRQPNLLLDFLQKLVKYKESYRGYNIRSQTNLPKLPNHEMASRPDVIINLKTEGNDDIIFIESKFGAREGRNQLQRYADHLAITYKDSKNKYLVYITYGFDPKEEESIVEKQTSSVNFIQVRWSDFYNLLRDYQKLLNQKDSLIAEMLNFMEEKRMNENKQLTPFDLTGVFSFPKVLDFFLTSLEGEVEKKFVSIIGKKPLGYNDQFGEQIRIWGRFALWNSTGNEFAIEVGYFFDRVPKSFPQVGVEIEVADSCPQWKKVISIFKEIEANPICENETWHIDGDIDEPNPHLWTSIKLYKPLTDFVSEQDQMYAIKKRLVWCLDQVAILKKRYPSLEWKVK